MTTREEIVLAAAEEIRLRGYAGSSMSAIAARLGLTKGALVRQFPTKEDLAIALADHFDEGIMRVRERSLQEYPESGLHAMIRFLLGVHDLATNEAETAAAIVLISDQSTPGMRLHEVLQDWINHLREFMRIAQEQGKFEGPLDAEAIARWLFVTNIGEGTLRFGGYSMGDEVDRLHYTRLVLRCAGVSDIDAVIEEVISARRG